MLDKKSLSEQDICTKFITPAIVKAGWDSNTQFLQEVSFTRKPRYYQQIADNRTVEAIAKGQNRILLVMATGTGKTYTAFQIIYRLWKAKAKKRILFLADRNALIDQTRRGDFKHFNQSMTVVKNHNVNKAYEVYLALYQGLTGTEESRNIFKQFTPDFFDLIVVDECHRGSARDDSAWREILDYFKSATQIGFLINSVDKKLDLFDLICHVAFDQPPLTRNERANNVRKRDYFTKYGEQARQVLEALLDKYADE